MVNNKKKSKKKTKSPSPSPSKGLVELTTASSESNVHSNGNGNGIESRSDSPNSKRVALYELDDSSSSETQEETAPSSTSMPVTSATVEKESISSASDQSSPTSVDSPLGVNPAPFAAKSKKSSATPREEGTPAAAPPAQPPSQVTATPPPGPSLSSPTSTGVKAPSPTLKPKKSKRKTSPCISPLSGGALAAMGMSNVQTRTGTEPIVIKTSEDSAVKYSALKKNSPEKTVKRKGSRVRVSRVQKDHVIISFHIEYQTVPGEIVVVCGSHPDLGAWDYQDGLRLSYSNGICSGEKELRLDGPMKFEYQYVVVAPDHQRWEEGKPRWLQVPLSASGKLLKMRDFWKGHGDVSDSAVFRRVLYHRPGIKGQDDSLAKAVKQIENFREEPSFTFEKDQVAVQFAVDVPRVGPNRVVRVCGNVEGLGLWDPKNALELRDPSYPVWKACIVVPRGKFPLQYKYLICDRDGGNPEWELGDNRVIGDAQDIIMSECDLAAAVINDWDFRHAEPWKKAGVAVPVFSLKSGRSFGCGEFLDLKILVEWAVECGFHVLQLLPVNDTSVTKTWKDSYPYSTLSVFALHPMYINLEALGDLPESILSELNARRAELNQGDVDYEAVVSTKLRMLRQLYNLQKDSVLHNSAFVDWFSKNKSWLQPYALFCFLRDLHNTSDFRQWGSLSEITEGRILELCSPSQPHYDAIAFHYYVQYNLHLQLKEASEYARFHRVALKGDLPIGVNRHCVDVWQNPHLFRTHMQTGAPPDQFAELGQNWGFPTYEWDEMAKDDFAWWRARLGQMANYFHAFRIDHILGFFRIWEIPSHAIGGLLGRFRPVLPIHKNELESSGLWDIGRLTEPYIRGHHLAGLFGDIADYARVNFLDETSFGVFRLKDHVRTERAVAAVVSDVKDLSKAQCDRLKSGLISIVDNVVLLQDDEDPDAFHPRIEMMKTSSYGELDDGLKAQLYRLYVEYFYKRQEVGWRDQAMRKLPMMKTSTDMLVCGEDLGMVPDCVAGTMEEMKILGLRIQRMSVDPKREFNHPADYPYRTVCTPSCHDSSNIRAWWEEDRGATQRFFNEIMGEHGEAPSFCEPWVVKKIIEQHLYSPSALAIFPIQDVLGIDGNLRRKNPAEETINVPANPEHYWKHRLHITLEFLLKHKEFSLTVKGLIRNSARV